jgi:acetyl esterase/lipase
MPEEDPVPVGFDDVLSAYRELAENRAKAKYVFVPSEF